MRREKPNCLEKVILIEGDAVLEDCGLSEESKKLLMDTNVIFHAAATVRFDEKIRLALNINVKNAKFFLTFAKNLPNLKVQPNIFYQFLSNIFYTSFIKRINY